MAIHDEEERDLINVTDDDMKPGTPLWRSSPEELWLAVGDEPEDWLHELTDCVDVTWAADFCPVAVGVGYVRKDRYDSIRVRVAELERERDKLQDALALTRNACASRKAQRDEYRRMAECAAIMAVCGYFSRMRGPDAWLDHGSWDEYPELFACAGVDLRSFQHGTRFYAGSAPVPAEKAVDVDHICNAYESGVGHRGRPTANINPYREGTPEHEAYAIGAKGEAAQAEARVALCAIPESWVETARKAKLITADVCRAYPETAAAHINGLADLLLAAKANGGGK